MREFAVSFRYISPLPNCIQWRRGRGGGLSEIFGNLVAVGKTSRRSNDHLLNIIAFV